MVSLKNGARVLFSQWPYQLEGKDFKQIDVFVQVLGFVAIHNPENNHAQSCNT